jgi:dienelactone hydrolase
MRFSILMLFILFLSCNTSSKKEISIKESVDKVAFDAIHGNLTDFKTITFPSKDGLPITADLYLVKEPKNFILLCHQAGFSRGEYIEAAKKLNSLGYSCVAIDQRSGKIANNIINETAKRTKEKGLPQKYLDAKQDIEAAIDYVYALNKSKPIILIGSSYSASLSLYLATNNDKVKAVAAFSPGEYLKGINLTDYIKNLQKPIFVTSSKKEISQVEGIISKVISTSKTQFKPIEKGIHGSRMLWKSTKGNQDCWKSFEGFLTSVK